MFSGRFVNKDGHPGRDTFDFPFATTEWILKKIERNQVLNILHQVVFFLADPST